MLTKIVLGLLEAHQPQEGIIPQAVVTDEGWLSWQC
jgi:hypothetical protein